jgi:DNA-binding MarR family transcriptional regulator
VSDLAVADRMRPQSMAPVVRELEAAGLVSRRPDPSDGRRAIVDLTPEGRATLTDLRARRVDWLTRALESELSAAERAELARAVALLGRVADA